MYFHPELSPMGPKLKTCNVCKKEYANNAKTCVHCGAPNASMALAEGLVWLIVPIILILMWPYL